MIIDPVTTLPLCDLQDKKELAEALVLDNSIAVILKPVKILRRRQSVGKQVKNITVLRQVII
jgi:hypothetical protein